MRLLVCGPRNLGAECMPHLIHSLLPLLRAASPYPPGFVFMHGAARGADTLWEEALACVVDRNPLLWLPIRRFPAQWGAEGKGAGSKRNQRMLEARPTYWLAAHWETEPTTPGTLDMVTRLRKAGVPGSVALVPKPLGEE